MSRGTFDYASPERRNDHGGLWGPDGVDFQAVFIGALFSISVGVLAGAACLFMAGRL